MVQGWITAQYISSCHHLKEKPIQRCPNAANGQTNGQVRPQRGQLCRYTDLKISNLDRWKLPLQTGSRFHICICYYKTYHLSMQTYQYLGRRLRDGPERCTPQHGKLGPMRLGLTQTSLLPTNKHQQPWITLWITYIWAQKYVVASQLG